MGIRNVKLSQSIASDDLLDAEYVDLVRDDLVSRFADMYPTAQEISIAVSHSLALDNGVVFTVEGIVK